MKIKCKNVSNRGNGDNCKKSPKDPLSQSCTFNRECSELNNKEQSGKFIAVKNLNDCYAKTYEHDYWQEKIVPQVQEKLNSLDKHEIKENKKKEKVRV